MLLVNKHKTSFWTFFFILLLEVTVRVQLILHIIYIHILSYNGNITLILCNFIKPDLYLHLKLRQGAQLVTKMLIY